MQPRPRELVTRSAPLGAVVLAAFWVVGALAAVRISSSLQATSYLAASPVLWWWGATAALCLVTAGGLGLLVARRGALGPLALLTGSASVAPAWAGWEQAPVWLRAAALVLSSALAPALVHLTAVDARGRAAAVPDRRLVVLAYTLTGTLVLARALVYEPLRDRDCLVSCSSAANPLLVWSEPVLARRLGDGILLASVVLAALALVRAAVRILPRRSSWPFGLALTLPAGLALLGEAASAVVRMDQAALFDAGPGRTAYVVTTAGLLALGVGIGWATAWRLRVARQRVGVLATGLDGLALPGELESQLAQALRDDSLEIRYPLPGSHELVDATGRPAPIDADDPRAVLRVTRAQQPVALVLHDRDHATGEDLEAGLGPLARLVLDNERLRAAASAHLVELQESRARIVAASDDLRRAVERDLHDSAQQRLLAAAFELRLARAECAGGDSQVARELDRLVDAAAVALADLREFAHGVFPVVLDEAGLEAAMMSIADGAAVPVELDLGGLDGVGPRAGRAAYGVVRAGVESAAADGVVDVRVHGHEGLLTVEISGCGPVDAVRLGDRVGAVGGELEVGNGCVRAVIPCAS